tara:strand:- start:36951 stop:37508 length:558 start_codon:yes stop_codon:yes gene_type:complete
MNNVLYNNMYQIVQTEDYVMILVEMAHDARIIPIDKNHRPDALKPWLGDSIAHWDGDVLVIETRNLHPQQAPSNIAALSDQGVVIERFSRFSEEQILYEFEVRDPIFYSEAWGAKWPSMQQALSPTSMPVMKVTMGCRAYYPVRVDRKWTSANFLVILKGVMWPLFCCALEGLCFITLPRISSSP